MKKLITILLTIILCQSIEGFFGLPRQRIDRFVVNGTDVDIEDIPFQISLRRFGSHTCGGSIVTHDIVLTAAHCVDPYSVAQIVEWYTVRAGATHRDQGEEFNLINAVYHANFTDETYQFDVALLKLARSFVWGPTIQPVVLAESNFVLPYGDIAVVSGWGRLTHGGVLPTILQAADVEILDTTRCSENYITEGFMVYWDMFCAGSFYGKVDSCHGDSGGPLVLNGTQIGLVSWGLECAQHDFPGVYASVFALRDWIDEHIETL